MAWPTDPRPAKSLVVLRDQILRAVPNAPKGEFGMIGDQAHQQRASDHNPSNGIVHALDIPHYPSIGLDCEKLATHMRTVARDPRVKYCLAPDTRILTASLAWKPIEAIATGDELIAFDESGPEVNRRLLLNQKNRNYKGAVNGPVSNISFMSGQKMRTATVEAVTIIQRPCFDLITDHTHVVASADHMWLAARSHHGKYRSWVQTDELKPGVPLQYFTQPWENEQSFDAGWLAGLFDGEGCLSLSPGGGWFLSMSQREGAVLEKAIFLLDQFGVHFEVYDNGDVKNITIRGGLPDTLRFLGRFRNTRLTSRAIDDRIWENKMLAGAWESTIVREIRPIGVQDVVAVRTSTRTFIAEGIFSHNCIWNLHIFGDDGYAKRNGRKAWALYSASDHEHHLHISVNEGASADDEREWDIGPIASTGELPPATRPLLKRGSTGADVRLVQSLIMTDGIYGPATEDAVARFQREQGTLDVDGIVGPETWRALERLLKPSEPGEWQTDITATVFGGSGDEQPSAYSDVQSGWPERPGVALPFRFAGDRPKVEVMANSRSVVCPIVDVGPWNTNDPYWEKGTRPQAESGTDMKGRKTNKAGIDLTPAAASAIGVDGKGVCNWRFL